MTKITKTLTITLAFVGMCLLTGVSSSDAQKKLNITPKSAIRGTENSKTLLGDPSIYVTKTDDTNDTCNPGVNCSLREAVALANTNPSYNGIYFSIPSSDPNCANGVCTITLTNGEIAVATSGSLAINGTGANTLTISGGGTSRIFYTTANATFRNLTLTGGNGVGAGNSGYAGAIYADGGTLTLEYVNVTANTTDPILSIGAIRFNGGTNHQISNSTFSANISGVNCGAISVDNTSLTIVNTTISGNTATSGYGGGFCNSGSTVTLRNSTITGNTAATAGGIMTDSVIDLGNTIVAGNFANANNDIKNTDTIISSGNNLIGDNSDVESFFPAGTPNAGNDFVGTNAAPVNAFLAPLRNYGGTTPTHALLKNSPAINNGNGALAGTPATDQRLTFRAGATDIGAFERNVFFDVNTLPNGYGLVSYNQQLTASRVDSTLALTKTNQANASLNMAVPPMQFEIVPIFGQNLPLGLTLDSNGLISGTPTSLGTYTFTVKATDSFDQMAGVQQYTIQTFGPTAASVSVSGKILNGKSGISRAFVSITDATGTTRTVKTNSFGVFRLDNLQAGQTYIFNVTAKGFSFAPQVVTVNEDLTEFDFSSL